MGENVTLESLKPRIEPKKIKRQGFKEQKHRQKTLKVIIRKCLYSPGRERKFQKNLSSLFSLTRLVDRIICAYVTLALFAVLFKTLKSSK